MGLSPRVRGNHDAAVSAAQETRSIPACAGEPADGTDSISRAAVYPRVCGGTPSCVRDMAASMGLSPRVRGNLLAI